MRNFSFFRIILILSFFLFSSSIYADSGIFQTYVIIDSGSGNQFYAGGINADGAQVFNNSVLGTFDCESTLILNGGEVKTFKNNGSNVFGANIYYRIYSTSGSGGSFIQIPLSFNGDLGNGDQKWQTSGHNVNMLSGLAAGTYNLEVYWDANTSDGTQFDSNNGTNFKATFTVEDNTPPPGQIQFAAPQLALDNVPEATQYNVVYELDIPTSSDWDVNSQIPYAVNNVSQLNGNPINRVAYLMQLDTKWVWVSYDAITQNYNEIGIPVDYQKQQVVSNMNVFASPNTGVTSGTNIQTGNIEFWSNCYAPTNYPNVPNAQGGNYDFGDSYLDPNTNQTYTPDCYGSFQIHNYANAQTIFGFNRWSSSIQNGPSDLGIGNNTNFQNGPHTDWTYTINAGIYNIKKLYILTLNNDNVASPLEDIIAQCEVSSLDAPTVMDNCAGEITGTTNTELPITTQGTTVVTWTFDDGSGNTSTQTQNVIIQDTEGPELTCNDVTVYLDNNGNATLGANSVTDFSGTQGQGNWSYGQYFAFEPQNFEEMPNYSPINIYANTYDAWNNSGNPSSTPFLTSELGHPGQDLKWAVRRWTSNMDGTIYISGDFFDFDTGGGDGAHVRIFQNSTEVDQYLNIPGNSTPYALELTVSAGDTIDFAIDPKFEYTYDTTHFTAKIEVVSAADNCGLDSISLSTTSFNCNNIGSNNNISIIAQDVNGNDSNCSFNVTVVDDIEPIGDLANLPDINEHCEVTVLTDPGVTDNCGSVTISNDATLPITTLGTTVVTWTYDDGNGNTSTQTQNVIIGGSTTLMNSTTNDGSFESNAVFSVNPSPTTLPPVWTINSSIAGMGGLLSNPPHTAVLAGADGNDAIFADNNGATPNTTTATSYDLLGGTYTSVTEGDVFTWSFIINSWSANSTGSLYLNFGSGDILVGTGIANDQDLATYNTISGTYTATAADAAGGQLNVAFSIGTGTGGTYGNVYGDNVQISVVKSQAPIITCPSDVTVNTDINSNTGIATYSLPTAFDTCDGALTVNQTAGFVSGSAFPLGTTVNTFEATDSSGNTSECSFTVTVVDNEDPTVTCPQGINVDATGANGAAVTWTGASAADNVGVVSFVSNFNSGDTFPIGQTTVTYTATDAAGNSETCSFDVEVVGVSPDIECPADIIVSNDAGQCDAVVNFTATETVGIPASTITYSQNPNTSFPLGTTIVTATATNAVGTSSCTFTVTVNDTEDPTITCANDVTLSNDPGKCFATTTLTPPTAADNCVGPGNALDFDGVNDYVLVPDNPSLDNSSQMSWETWVKFDQFGSNGGAGAQPLISKWFSTGPTNERNSYWIVEGGGSLQIFLQDVNLNTNSLSSWNHNFSLNEWYHIAVTFNAGQLAIYVDGNLVLNGGVSVSTIRDGSEDLRLGDWYSTFNSSYSTFNGQMDEVRIWNVTRTQAEIQANMNSEISSATGLVASYNFNQGVANSNNAGVTILTDSSGNGNNGTLTNFALNGTTSNWVEGQTFNLSLTNDAPATFAIGDTTVTWTATDAAGNTAMCTQTVTVIDNEVPTITCPSDITNVVATGASGAVVTYTAPVGKDNCTGATTTIVTSPTAGLASGSTFPIGTTTVTYTVTDAANNKAECSFDVTVVGVSPDIECPANITVENDAGLCGAIVTFAATETVGIPASTISYSHASGSEFPVGTTTVTATATNAVGTSECTFTVTVNDTEDPTIACAEDVEINNTPGQCYGEVVLTPPTATDNCNLVTSNALDFDGVNDYVNTSIARPSLGNTWTMSAWIKYEGAPNATYQAVFGGNSTNFFIGKNSGNTSIGIQDGSQYINNFGGNNAFDGAWHQIAVTRNNTVMSLYLDGQFITSRNYSTTGTGDIWIGLENQGNPRFAFNGRIDEVRIWNTVRTQTEIQANINDELDSATGLLASYHFNEGIAESNNAGVTIATDASGNGNDGTLTNFALTGTSSNWVEGNILTGPIISNDAPATFAIGDTTVTWTATDAAGNTAMCTQTVTVIDNEVPTITCPSDITDVVATSASGAVVNYTAPVGTDNCTGVNTALTAGFASGSTFPIGTTTVTYEVTDAANNKAECSFDVTVVGVTPDIVCPANITVENDAGQCGAIVTFAATETVGIPASTITYSHASGSEFPVGTTTVTATATNAVGTDSCTFTITVNDNEDPVITCVASDSRDTDPGQCDYTVVGNEFDATFTDNCSDGSITNNYNNAASLDGAIFPKGSTTVVWTVDDGNGQTATCSTVITVNDNEDPVITCVASDSRDTDPGQCDYTVVGNEFDATFTDNCPDGSITNNYNNAASLDGAIFPKGSTTVVWTVDDGNGQTATCSTVITVNDNEDPVITCVASDSRDTDPGQCDYTVVGNEFDATFTDNCPDGSITNNYNNAASLDGAIFPKGSTTVVWTVDDGNGQIATCSTVITVNDNEDPVIACVASDSRDTDPGQCDYTVVGNEFDATFTDNCPDGSITNNYNNAASLDGAIFPKGSTTVVWTVDDGNGQTATCSRVITVNDNEDPVITCVASDSRDTDPGQCDYTVVGNEFDATFTDNCPDGSITNNYNNAASLDGAIFPKGSTTVVWTVDDGNGQTATCSTVITVNDNEDPVITCVASDSRDTDPGQCDYTVVGNEFDATFTDNCPDGSITNNYNNAASLDGAIFPKGSTTVVWTVDDGNGQTATCSTVITVNDNEDPVITCVASDSRDTDPGQCDYTVVGNEFDATFTDNCPDGSITNNYNNAASLDGAIFPKGSTTVVWTVDDGNGQTATCSRVITVNDNEDPVITCVASDSRDTDPGQCDYTVVGNEFDATFTDNCPDGSLTNDYNGLNTLAGAVFPQGSTDVTWTVNDGNGQIVDCTITVVVEDNEAPVVNCLDLQIQLDEFGQGEIVLSDIDGNSTDNCGIASITLSQTDFDCDDIGGDLDELIISEYVDGSPTAFGNPNNDVIEIYNGTGVSIDLFAENYRLAIYENGSSIPTLETPLLLTVADRDVYVISNPFAPGFGQADQTGNVGFDGNDAVALLKDGVVVDLIGEIGVNAVWTVGGNTTAGTTLVRNVDALQGNIGLIPGFPTLGTEWTQEPQDTFSNLGDHNIEITELANNVILTVTDTSGNVSICEGNVTVIDDTDPVVVCQPAVVELDAFGNGAISAADVTASATDACGIASATVTPNTFDCSNIGSNTVTLTITDSNGNTASCTTTVTVNDNVAPEVNTQDITIQLDANGVGSIIPADVDDSNDPTNDACGIASLSVSPNTFDCSDVGTEGVVVTLTVTDVNGNENENTAIVTVIDVTPPTAVCNDITVLLDATGNYELTTADIEAIGAGSSDACGPLSYSVSPNSFTCDNEGDNSVTLTVTDANGNFSTCQATVTVDGDFPEVDITASDLPEFCQGAVIVLTANSDLAIAYEWFFEGEEIANATNESIEVDEDGEYTVIVTSATNCTAENNFIVSGFDKGGLLSAYTILATEEVFLIGSNIVESGGVGAMLPGSGNVKLHQASTVVDFTQAATISLQQGSDAGEEILSAANPTLPDFMFNTVSNAGSPNAIVTGTQTLSGSVYNIVEVREGAEVTFSAPNVFINELKTWKDSAIEFEGCTNVLINERFQLAQNSTINLDSESKVTFYVNDDVSIEKGSYVRASIYAYNHNITAKGLNGNGKNIEPEPTFMTGLFIANRVQGNKNVVWNADDLCDSCPVTYPSARTSEPKDVLLGEFDAKGWPSPSDTQFNIKVSTKNKADVVTIEVFDMGNKLVHSKQFNHDDTYRFGEKLEGGVYIVKISQGGSLKILRLIKN